LNFPSLKVVKVALESCRLQHLTVSVVDGDQNVTNCRYCYDE